MIILTEILWRLTQGFRLLIDGVTENELILETKLGMAHNSHNVTLDELEECEKLVESLQEQLQATELVLNVGDLRQELEDGGTTVFRSKDLEFSPSNWITDHELALSPTQAYIRKGPLKKLRVANTNSMLPWVDGDHAVLMLPKTSFKFSKLKVGDVVVWNKDGSINSVCHRIVKINKSKKQVITQGDNITFNDGWIDEDEIEGVIVAVVY